MKYILTRDVTNSECDWIDNTIKKGTMVYRYTGPTYGCIGYGVAVTLAKDEIPFFELPYDALEEVY